MRSLLCILLLVGNFLVVDALMAKSFHPWSEKVFSHVRKEYGQQAEKRVRYLHDLFRDNQNKTVHEKLLLANNTMNKLPWIADKEHWDKVDYWATPMETVATFGGDCEDIAIVKWLFLRYLGIPAEKLRLAYVKVRSSGESHMILAYVDRIDLPLEKRVEYTWVLDNIEQRLMKATERKDILAIYATDEDGNMVVFKESENGLGILARREHTKMAKLEELKKKISENLEFYKKLNDGRPLYSY